VVIAPLCAIFGSEGLESGGEAMKKSARSESLRRRFTGSRSWLAVGTLAAYTVMGSSRQALAATKPGSEAAPGAGGPVANLPVKRFNIAAGGLDDGIKAYEQATGMSVRVELPNGTLAGFQAKGVTGLHTAEEGMRLLLEGTGLSYAAQGASTMVVSLRAKESVDVHRRTQSHWGSLLRRSRTRRRR
jgi:catecholate siderophore receptor